MLIRVMRIVLLAAVIAVLQAFTLPRQWRIQTKLAVAHRASSTMHRKLDEVCISNLPRNFDLSRLQLLLKQRGLSDYGGISIKPYDTTDGKCSASLFFDDIVKATNVISSFDGISIDRAIVGASFMPKVVSIVVYIDRHDDANQGLLTNFLRNNDNIINYRSRHNEKPERSVFIECKSASHAARMVHLMTNLEWKGRAPFIGLCFDNVRKFRLRLSNLDPAIGADNLAPILDRLLGPDQYLMANMLRKDELQLTGSADVHFATQEQADRAESILKECKLMDRNVEVQHVDSDRFSLDRAMHLGNVDSTISIGDIEAMCNAVLNDKGAVLIVKRNFNSDQSRPMHSCRIYFASTELRDRCIDALNGKLWRDCLLQAVLPSSPKTIAQLFVGNFPLTLSKTEGEMIVREALQGIPIRSSTMGLHHPTRSTGHGYVKLFSLEDAMRALKRLDGLLVHGSNLHARIEN